MQSSNRATRNPIDSRSALLLGTVLGIGQLVGCGNGTEAPAAESAAAALAACHLDDGTVEPDAEIGACDPQAYNKLTICHVPPGNPGNAHTLCLGSPACPSHLKHHYGDHMGPCKVETPCPTPTPSPPSTSTSTPSPTGYGTGDSRTPVSCKTKTGYPGTGGNEGGGSGGSTPATTGQGQGGTGAGKPSPVIIP